MREKRWKGKKSEKKNLSRDELKKTRFELVKNCLRRTLWDLTPC